MVKPELHENRRPPQEGMLSLPQLPVTAQKLNTLLMLTQPQILRLLGLFTTTSCYSDWKYFARSLHVLLLFANILFLSSPCIFLGFRLSSQCLHHPPLLSLLPQLQMHLWVNQSPQCSSLSPCPDQHTGNT